MEKEKRKRLLRIQSRNNIFFWFYKITFTQVLGFIFNPLIKLKLKFIYNVLIIKTKSRRKYVTGFNLMMKCRLGQTINTIRQAFKTINDYFNKARSIQNIHSTVFTVVYQFILFK